MEMRIRIDPMTVTARSVQSNLPPPCTSFISSATAINETDWIAMRRIAIIAPKATRIISERNATARTASAPPIRWSHNYTRESSQQKEQDSIRQNAF